MAAALLVLALLTALRLPGTVDSDVAWQLWIAGRIHAGAHLYRDIIEVNPPLWFWMALPIDRLASPFHLRIEAALLVATSGAAAASVIATNRLLPDLSPNRRRLFLIYAALVLIGMPWVHLGQREQLVLVGTLPYATLVATRATGRPISFPLALSIGFGASLGFALKHYFLVVPASLELWLYLGGRNFWRAIRPELLAMLAVGALYACAILLWAPDYFTRIVPLVRLSYGSLGAETPADLLGPFIIAGAITFVTAALALRLINQPSPLASALLVSAAAFAAVYAIQFKGWIYHAIPTLGCSSLALATILAEAGASHRLLRLFGPAILSLPLFLAADEQLHTPQPLLELQSAVSDLRPGASVGFLTTETAFPWSVTLQHQLRYPSRYMGFWMIPAIVADERKGSADPRLARLGHQIVSDTVADFTCARPQRIIVARPRPGDRGFDILPFFLRDPAFAALLSHYRADRRTDFETYDLVTPLPHTAFRCRQGI